MIAPDEAGHLQVTVDAEDIANRNGRIGLQLN
jgi:hypothetical protein